METLKELLSYKSGLTGIAVIVILSIAAIYSYFAFQKYIALWRNTNYWSLYPSAVPPEWVSAFNPHSAVPTKWFKPINVLKKELYGSATNITYIFKINYKWDVPPNDVKIVINATYTKFAPAVIIKIYGPKFKVTAIQDTITNLPNVISLNNFDEAKNAIMNWANLNNINATLPTAAIFRQKGTYYITVTFVGIGKFKASSKLLVDGTVYGLMGTDVFGRDIFIYTMLGLPYGLLIGILTSIIAATWGTLYGLVSGYFGGWVDRVLQRILDVWYSIPGLPLLILLTILLKPNIWLIMVLIAVFSWMGVAKVVRSMVLQLKNENYVLASKAVGATSRWIMLKHILPQIAPFMMAQVALGVPGAILTEVSLDFLGLGDPNVPTWGWMLHDANVYGAAVNGYWWWVLPPGIMTALVALGFALIGYAMDVILNPRLREV